jgi:lipid II:glycine glycyltransferase (peptidoglycan interpeptide bridge formation enzyme)
LIFTNDSNADIFRQILSEEGYSAATRVKNNRTILMDVSPPLDTLRRGLSGDWKRNLKAAEKRQLKIVEGTGDDLFETVIDIYKDMVSRKGFPEPTDITKFRRVQALLPDALKMKVSICSAGDEACAALVWSEIGEAAIELFAATRHTSLKIGAAYSLRWRLVEHLRQGRIQKYNLNGINPEQNPGCYHVKSGLAGNAGSEVSYLGAFESKGNIASEYCVRVGEGMRVIYDRLRARTRTG